MSVFSCRTMGGVGICGMAEDDPDGGCADAEEGTGPMIMGMHTEGGREDMNEVDWAAAVDAAAAESLAEDNTDDSGGWAEVEFGTGL